MRVSTLDGRQFINEVVQTAWTTPFPPEAYTKPLSVKERRSKRAPESAPPGTDPSTDIQPSDHIKSKHQLGFEESLPLPPPGHDSRRICHFVMNLPDTALEFLDAFRPSFERLRELYGEEARRVYATMPMVHVHCFTRELEEDNARKDILQVRSF